MSDIINEVVLGHFGSCYLALGPTAKPKYLKFSLETRSESFEPLMDFLTFLVQKLRSKINKLIN